MRIEGVERAEPNVQELVEKLTRRGASFTVLLPGGRVLRAGRHPDRAQVAFRDSSALRCLVARDHLGLANAYIEGRIEIHGEARQVMGVLDELALGPRLADKLRFALRWWLRDRRRMNRDGSAFHYDRPPEFFLPWLERWRSYSHGFYTSLDDAPSEAQARKMQHAIDALGLKPGMHVFDMGGGWGCFVEFAGLQGIHVHAITISAAQHAFVRELIESRMLPCTIELVDFVDYRPARRFDGAVFMGTLEHMPDYRRVARFLNRHLEPGAALYADFCTTRGSSVMGPFLQQYMWRGVTGYVDLARLVGALIDAGFNVQELADDTLSYAYTVRDWAKALESVREELAARFGQNDVRAFQLFLWGCEHFFESNGTQAYHLVASRDAASLDAGG